MADQKYTDAEIDELDKFARAVSNLYEGGNWKHYQLGAMAPEAYRQYFAEVIMNLSGMHDDPRRFFESDLFVRRNWGDIIAMHKAEYDRITLAESATPATVNVTPGDKVAALESELAKIKADLAALIEAQKPAPPVLPPPPEDDQDSD